MAADWTYKPLIADYSLERTPPRTLINAMTDGKEIRRQVGTFTRNRWRETYIFIGADHDTAIDFYDLKGFTTAFTKLSYDDYASSTAEQTVCFDGPWIERRMGSTTFMVTLTFRRVSP